MGRTRWLIWLLCCLIVLWGVDARLASLVNERVRRAVQDHLPGSEVVEARVHASPLVQLLRGHVDALELVVRNVPVDGFAIDQLIISGRAMHVDRRSLMQGVLRVYSAEELTFQAALTEKTLTAYVQKAVPEAVTVRVELSSGKAVLHGTVDLFGTPIDVSVDGELERAGATRVRFVPQGIVFARQSLPRSWVETITSTWRWELDFAPLPVPVHVQSVDVEEGRIKLRGLFALSSEVA